MDAVSFLKYVLDMSPEAFRLGSKRILALLVELRARIRDIRWDVLGHQMRVRRSKSGKLVSLDDMLTEKCMHNNLYL